MNYNTAIYSAALCSALVLTTPTNIQSQEQFLSAVTEISPKDYLKPVHYDIYADRLNIIKNLPDNWDGYGAVRIDVSVYYNVRSFLSELDNFFFNYLKEEDIYCTPYGTVVLDFEKNEEIVSVEVGESKIGFFTEFSDKDLNLKSKGDTFYNKISPSLQQALIALHIS